jgi:hypothetical protein
VPRPPLPRWFWLLPLLAIAAWWPLEPWWQSDDFFALHYAQHARNVLHDFVGPQYGATDVWLFWRPLITASLWLEQQFGGPSPLLSHASNVVAHGASTLLVACIWRRFLAPANAFAAALLWALLPSHQSSIAWVVGRVDSHTAVWYLLAVLLALRAHESTAVGERARRWPLAAATAAALLSKELAIALPACAAGVVFVRAAGPARERVRAAVAATAPAWIVWFVYLPLRWLALGAFGGYDSGAAPGLASCASGLAKVVADLLVPLRWSGGELLAPRMLWIVAAALPVAAALLAVLGKRARLVGGALVLFLTALVPLAAFLPAADNPQTLRLYYLPAVALTGAIAAAGRWYTLAVLLAFAWPFVAMRSEQLAADRESAAMHRALLQRARDGAPEPLFVAGLPHTNRSGTVLQLHFGVDRMLQPPFTDAPHALCALRPLDPSPAAFRLANDGELPPPLPAGSTWFFAGDSVLLPVTRASALPPLPITGDDDGLVDLTTPRLDAMTPENAPRVTLRTPGVRPEVFRLTVFTAGGYLATLFLDHAAPDATDGVIDLRRWFAEPRNDDNPLVGPGRYALGDGAFIAEGLPIPTTMDLALDFPVLLEGGTFDLAKLSFAPTHRAARLLRFRFDRRFTDWKRRVQGLR